MITSTLDNYIKSVITENGQIDPERKESLKEIADYVAGKVRNKEQVRLVFICTHNSRRSHMGQIWAQTAAYYYEIPDVLTYSGGTEATAFNPRAVKAMSEAGFHIGKSKKGENPVYEVKYAKDADPLLTFSKKYDHKSNPDSDFCAVMTCSEADRNCPFIPGAESRVSLPYEDPKEFDGTPDEEIAYRERARQIGREMMYLFSLVDK